MRKQEFNSKLISLLPLDEVPVHVHRFAARAPCDSKGSGCPGVSVESSRGRLSPAKSEDRKGGEGKTDANLTIFLSTFPAGHILLQAFIFVASRLSAWTLVRRAMVAPARAPANAPTAMLNRFISILTSVGSHRRVGAALVQVPEVFAAQKLDADFLGVCQVCAAIPPGPLPERNLKSLQREQLLDILLRAADFSRHLRQGP